MTEKPNKISQWYGYMVCLIAVVVFLFSLTGLINALFDLRDPIHGGSGFFAFPQVNLSSFENFKVDKLAQLQINESGESEPLYVPSDEELQAMYQAAREDQITNIVNRAYRMITIDIIMIIVAAGLFVWHWKWLSRMREQAV